MSLHIYGVPPRGITEYPGENYRVPLGGIAEYPGGDWKRTSGNSLSPFGAQNKDISTGSQTLLAGVKLRLPTQAAIHHTSIVYLSSGFL